jgi:hypothetical protein
MGPGVGLGLAWTGTLELTRRSVRDAYQAGAGIVSVQ